MPDPKVVKPLDFDVRKVYERAIDKAQRYALSSLFPGDVRGQVVDETPEAYSQVGQALLCVQADWRKRMAQLRAEGWSKIKTHIEWAIALNCPPVTVMTNHPTLRPCRHYRICPFCWARYYVQQCYLAIEYAFYGTNRVQWLDPALKTVRTAEAIFSDLVVVLNTWHYPQSRIEIGDVMNDVRATRKMVVREIPHVGMVVLNTVEPGVTDEGRTQTWQRTERVLAIVDPGMPDPAPAITHPTLECSRIVQRFRSAKRNNIAAAVGRAFAYPHKLMHSSIPESSVAILNAEHSFRMSDYYGVLRNRSKRKRGETQLQFGD